MSSYKNIYKPITGNDSFLRTLYFGKYFGNNPITYSKPNLFYFTCGKRVPDYFELYGYQTFRIIYAI